MDKLIKENDTHVWRETEAGIGYVYPKNAFWLFLEKQAEEPIIYSLKEKNKIKLNKESK